MDTIKGRTVKSVDIYISFDGGAFFGRNPSVPRGIVSYLAILTSMDNVREQLPEFANAVVECMREYEIFVKTRPDMPSPNDKDALREYMRGEYTDPITYVSLMATPYILTFVVAFGTPDEGRRLSAEERKKASCAVYAQSRLDSQYESAARELLEIAKTCRPSMDNGFDPEYLAQYAAYTQKFRPVAERINDRDKLMLIANRADVLARQEDVEDLSVKTLVLAWHGIAGFDSYEYEG